MTDIDVELTPGQTVNLGVTTPSVTLDVHVVATSGGGGGASALADLTDVDLIPAPYTNQVLTYDGTTSTWIPRYPAMLFVSYAFPVRGPITAPVLDFYTTLGGRPGDVLPVVGIDGTWWLQDEITYPEDNGIWVSTAAGTAEHLTPQPSGVGASIFTYAMYDGSTFAPSYITWMNVGGGGADVAPIGNNWTAVPTQATSVLYTKTTPADWDGVGDQELSSLLDELAARVRILEP